MEVPNLVANFHGASLSIEELKKVANALLGRYDAATAATRVVSARDVFVSRLDSGEPYSGHPRAAEYAKGLQLLAEGQNRYHRLLKLLLVGDASVGKSSYLLRLMDNIFLEGYMSTIGVDFRLLYRGFCDPVLPLSMESSPLHIALQIWDTAGQERFQTILETNYRNASGFMILFDLSNRYSFENIPRWVGEMRRYGREDAPAVLIGMKQDIAWPGEVVFSHPPSGGKDEATAATASEASGLSYGLREQYRQVSYDEGLAMAQQFDMPYVECSAKGDVHIEDALATLVYHIVRSRADLQRGVQENGRPPGPRGNGGATAGGATWGQCVMS